jgi:hypothetical protein
MRNYFNDTCAGRQIIGQPEDDLGEVEVRDVSHIFGGYVVTLVVTID